jgi:hypothetical protein
VYVEVLVPPTLAVLSFFDKEGFINFKIVTSSSYNTFDLCISRMHNLTKETKNKEASTLMILNLTTRLPPMCAVFST